MILKEDQVRYVKELFRMLSDPNKVRIISALVTLNALRLFGFNENMRNYVSERKVYKFSEQFSLEKEGNRRKKNLTRIVIFVTCQKVVTLLYWQKMVFKAIGHPQSNFVYTSYPRIYCINPANRVRYLFIGDSYEDYWYSTEFLHIDLAQG